MDNMNEVLGAVKNDIENNRENFDKYTMLEAIYELQNKGKEKTVLFPDGWYSGYSYDERIKLLTDAINNKEIVKATKHKKNKKGFLI